MSTVTGMSQHMLQNAFKGGQLETLVTSAAFTDWMKTIAVSAGLVTLNSAIPETHQTRVKHAVALAAVSGALILLGAASSIAGGVAVVGATALTGAALWTTLPRDVFAILQDTAINLSINAIATGSVLPPTWFGLLTTGLTIARANVQRLGENAGHLFEMLAGVISAYAGGAGAIGTMGTLLGIAVLRFFNVTRYIQPHITGIASATIYGRPLDVLVGLSVWKRTDPNSITEALNTGDLATTISSYIASCHVIERDHVVMARYVECIDLATNNLNMLVLGMLESGQLLELTRTANRRFEPGLESIKYKVPPGLGSLAQLHDLPCYQIKLLYRAIGIRHPNYKGVAPIRRRALAGYLIEYLTNVIYSDQRMVDEEAPTEVKEEYVKRHLLQTIFGMPDNMQDLGLPEMQPYFAGWCNTTFDDWLRDTEHPNRLDHFSFITEKMNVWCFSKSSGFWASRINEAKWLFSKTWDTDRRMFVRLLYVLGSSTIFFSETQSLRRTLHEQDEQSTTEVEFAWPIYGQFSWSDCAQKFVYDKTSGKCVLPKDDDERGEPPPDYDLLVVRTPGDHWSVATTEQMMTDEQATPEKKKEIEQKKQEMQESIAEEKKWYQILINKLDSLQASYVDKLGLTPVSQKIRAIISATSAFIQKQVSARVERWHEMLDGCECSQQERLDEQGSCTTGGWAGWVLRKVWDLWQIAKKMVRWTRRDGTTIDVASAVVETARFVYAHPMLVYFAVTLAEYAMKGMLEHILETMAVPIHDSNVGLEGYLEKTEKQYEADVGKECEGVDWKTQASAPQEGEGEDETKQKQVKWMKEHPHCVAEFRSRIANARVGEPDIRPNKSFFRPGSYADPGQSFQGPLYFQEPVKKKDCVPKGEADCGKGNEAVSLGELGDKDKKKDEDRSGWMFDIQNFIRNQFAGLLSTFGHIRNYTAECFAAAMEKLVELKVYISNIVKNIVSEIETNMGKAVSAVSAPMAAYLEGLKSRLGELITTAAHDALAGTVGGGAAYALETGVSTTYGAVVATTSAIAQATGTVLTVGATVGTGVANMVIEKQGYGRLSQMSLVALARYKPEKLRKLLTQFIDSMFSMLESGAGTAATASTVLTAGAAALPVLGGFAAFKLFLVSSRFVITEMILDATDDLVWLVQQVLVCQTYVDNIYGIIGLFSLDKLIAMFEKHAIRFPFVMASLKDINAGGSWSGRFARPDVRQRTIDAHKSGRKDGLIMAKRDVTGAYFIPADENDKEAKLVHYTQVHVNAS